jgi:hypothetical protein
MTEMKDFNSSHSDLNEYNTDNKKDLRFKQKLAFKAAAIVDSIYGIIINHKPLPLIFFTFLIFH